MKEAATLLKLSEMKGLEYILARDGFAFSNDQINAAIDRDQRLRRASTTDFSKYRTRKFQTQAAGLNLSMSDPRSSAFIGG